MVCGVDANVLVYAVIESIPEHETVRKFFDRRVRSGRLTCAVTFPTLLEFIHVVTDPKRFDDPLGMEESISLAEKFWNARNWRQIFPKRETGARAMELMKRHRLGRKRLLDTYLAATLLDSGVTALITCDESDFRVYRKLRLVNPLKHSGSALE